uniref:type I protein arginine methyltransferase n=2 Tax=Tetraselmis sp. GSL018 TaxID=582737 RepID=A0A061S8C2_9CHLO|mmetsp:Transcript_39371/g.93318  ORF Transcript_39371/g.93318 Transcript_39371/m.93318 type:complete len:533 (-) Transcript_39371:95-1693(-)
MSALEGRLPFELSEVTVTSLQESDDGSSLVRGSSWNSSLYLDPAGSLVLKPDAKSGSPVEAVRCKVTRKMISRAGRRLFALSIPPDAEDESGYQSYTIEVPEGADADLLDEAVDRCSEAPAEGARGPNAFDRKTDKGSADLYFYYYGMFQHQQNMMQDMVRTGTYYFAIMENRADFAGKVVVDVGAGTSILSQFAAQAGARKVYAVEASPMAKWADRLCKGNPAAAAAVQVLREKVEAAEIPERADILISEPMGTLLVNERMLESYLHARDHLLKPGGLMFPAVGRIHAAAYSDAALHAELAAKSAFWGNTNFFGVDLTPLYKDAAASFFQQVVIDAFDPRLLVSQPQTKVLDFRTIAEEDLYEIVMPLDLEVGSECFVHGIACWFDVLFDGSTMKRWLTTAPGQPTTHWFQLRCAVQHPLYLLPGSRITGKLRLKAHPRQSYDIFLTLRAPPFRPGGEEQLCSAQLDLKDPYYRQLVTGWPQQQQQQMAPQDSAAPATGPGDGQGLFPGQAPPPAGGAWGYANGAWATPQP